MVSISHWVGLTLPGMIELPGSFAGSDSSPRPERGPDARKRISLAILLSATASVLSAPEKDTSPSFAASCSKVLGAGSKAKPVISLIARAISAAQPSGALSPVPTAVPPIASLRMSFSNALSIRTRQLVSCAT
jgi:hypothetical protein